MHLVDAHVIGCLHIVGEKECASARFLARGSTEEFLYVRRMRIHFEIGSIESAGL